MKVSELASKYNVVQKSFEKFLVDTRYPYSAAAFTGEKIVKDSDINELLTKYDLYLKTEEEKKIQREKQIELTQEYNKEKNLALPKMLITSGFSFEGYRIVKYSGYISGDDAVQVNRGTAGFFSDPTNVGEKLMQSLTIIRRNALRELKEAAYDLGCNAVIGVDFDYLTLDPQTANSSGGTTYLPYVFGVTANGNAVIIEKIEDDEA
ncbi:MAG: heavy metal-binding domain-containing protein [Anaerotignum faecicola]|uniref:heavy metal-binding domain-containing protein n=1 Tax=Clostridium sp. MCC345 TaxID=2592645 RepID=UPI001C0154E2|nr:heavy metal-binding domain-containing protein [Clostridium sp. MCC345]